MKPEALVTAIQTHSGEFLCTEIHCERRKTVHFKHVMTPPKKSKAAPDLGKLREFYKALGSVRFYYDQESGDSAKYLGTVDEWEELKDNFNDWVEDLDEEEREDIVPSWVDSCLVVGETPHSGNYILVVGEGEERGHVYEFDHDGFEFTHEANDVIEYASKLLKPDNSVLTRIASHMRFATGDRLVQWWIEELRDSDGHVAYTKA